MRLEERCPHHRGHQSKGLGRGLRADCSAWMNYLTACQVLRLAVRQLPRTNRPLLPGSRRVLLRLLPGSRRVLRLLWMMTEPRLEDQKMVDLLLGQSLPLPVPVPRLALLVRQSVAIRSRVFFPGPVVGPTQPRSKLELQTTGPQTTEPQTTELQGADPQTRVLLARERVPPARVTVRVPPA